MLSRTSYSPLFSLSDPRVWSFITKLSTQDFSKVLLSSNTVLSLAFLILYFIRLILITFRDEALMEFADNLVKLFRESKKNDR